MKYAEIIANRIASLCKERGITVNKLATMSGVRQSTIDNIIKGGSRNPKIATLHRIALSLNMTVAEFLDFYEFNEFSFEDIQEDDTTTF